VEEIVRAINLEIARLEQVKGLLSGEGNGRVEPSPGTYERRDQSKDQRRLGESVGREKTKEEVEPGILPRTGPINVYCVSGPLVIVCFEHPLHRGTHWQAVLLHASEHI
jgi:hypothetical protein